MSAMETLKEAAERAAEAAAEFARIASEVAEGGALDAAGEALRAAASPIDDARASASYRIRTLRGLLERAVAQCREVATR